MKKITIYSKENCFYCKEAENLAINNDLKYTKYVLDKDFTREEFKKEFPFAKTYPQILVNNAHIGGYSQFKDIINN